jgi:hypothetical protein
MMRYLRKPAMLAALASFSSAWAANSSNTQILACKKIADDTQRLTCFDRESTVLAGAPAPIRLTPEQKIGLPRDKVDAMEASPNAPPEPQIKNFTAAVESVTVDGRGRQVYTLDNGQVWHQAESRPDFQTHPGEAVRIREGALGSFFLELQTKQHLATRVSRVR